MENICNYCLQPGNLFPTRENSLACAKCQPYVQDPSFGADSNVDYRSMLETQILIPIGENDNLHCGYCNKSFEKTLQYQNHMRNHRAERKFVCQHCTKAFSQSNNLRAHLRIHTNERPYKCTECGKAFTQVTNLNNHIRLHTGERPFACSEPGCDKAFAQVTNLNNHRKSHMRDGRNYRCDICHKLFAQAGLLNLHRQTHNAQLHPIPLGRPPLAGRLPGRPSNRIDYAPVACQDCGESFLHEKMLRKHMREDCREGRLSVPIYPIKPEARSPMRDQISRKLMAPDVPVKCLFGDCPRFFEDTPSLHNHLSRDHGLTINSNKAKPKHTLFQSDEVIEIDDDDSPSQPFDMKMPSGGKTNGKVSINQPKWEKADSMASDSDDGVSEDDDDEEDDDDSRSVNGNKGSGSSFNRNECILPEQMMLVCNICFSTFDDPVSLEKHVKSKHK